jgi:DNA-binding CsgD family transcriptional regulator
VQVRYNLENLSKRELEILNLIADFKKNIEISLHCSISTHTVETHKQHLKEKLNLKNASELIGFAVINKDKIISQLERLKINSNPRKN